MPARDPSSKAGIAAAPLTFPRWQGRHYALNDFLPAERVVIAFQVNDMTCGHCVSTVTKALKSVDKDAEVTIDLASHRVEVRPANSNAQELSDAIKEAGYTPVPA